LIQPGFTFHTCPTTPLSMICRRISGFFLQFKLSVRFLMLPGKIHSADLSNYGKNFDILMPEFD
jgi:hypothetical protein